MLIAYWLLLFLYVGLTFLYLATKTQQTKIPPWPILSLTPEQKPIKTTCKNHSDCPSTHVCLGNECIPKLLRSSSCDPATGQWISFIFQKATFAICACLEPHLMNQKFFGGNCDVNVGCGIYGRYLPDKKICQCDPGYKAVGLTCQQLPAIEYINLNPCEWDEIKVSDIKPSHGFHKDYIKELGSVKCVKRPCSFDALSGRPLKHGKFVEGWGCVCDPRYGLFGVMLDGANKKYLNTPGFDACASIFNQDLQEPINVKVITYFYLENRDPVSLIYFNDLNKDDLIPLLKGGKDIMLSQQNWQHDYAQYFFNQNSTFRARTRYLRSFLLYTNIEWGNEWYYIDNFSPAKCHEISDLWLDRGNDRVDAYELLYKNPVCRVDANDPHSDPMFRNKVIVNPHHITFKHLDYLHRFNAFVLEFNAKIGVRQWTLDLDYDYKVKAYMNMNTNAPNYPFKFLSIPNAQPMMIDEQS